MAKRKRKISQHEFVKKWFIENASRNVLHSESKKKLETSWQKKTGCRFEDVDRAIRKLCSSGFLIKIKKGVYRYDPSNAKQRFLHDFSGADKKFIKERDGYKCVICGLGPENGLELHVDHIKPKELGGTPDISNGQTLCARHNFIKKMHSQTETGKKMFIRLLEKLKTCDDPLKELHISFCRDILLVFQKYNINGHINWTDDIVIK